MEQANIQTAWQWTLMACFGSLCTAVPELSRSIHKLVIYLNISSDNKSKVNHFLITGKLLTSVGVPAPQTTSLCFGGSNFSDIFVTTGNGNVKGNAELERKYPDAGKIFKVTRKTGQTPLEGVKAFNFRQ